MHILVTMVFVSTFIITGLFGLNIESASAQSPTVSLEARINRSSSDTGDITISSAGDIIINPGDNVFLQWSSTNAEYCEGTGAGFLAGNFISGVAGVTEPTSGNSTVYTVTCYGDNSISSSDSVTVTTRQVAGNNTVNTIPPESPTPTGPTGIPTPPTGTPTPPTGTPTPPTGTPTPPTGTPTTPPRTPTTPPRTPTGIPTPPLGTPTPRPTTPPPTNPTPGTPPTSPSPAHQITGSVPVVTLERRVGSGAWSDQDVTINNGDQVVLRWYGKNANFGCVATNGHGFSTQSTDPFTTGLVDRANGTDSIVEPNVGESTVYTVTCAGSGGATSKSITITTPRTANSPTVELQVALHKDGQYVQDWTPNDIIMGAGEQVFIAWKSTNATKCSSGRYNLRIPSGQAAGGTDETITEPLAGSKFTYIISCTGPEGTVRDIINVTGPASGRPSKILDPFPSSGSGADNTPTGGGPSSAPTVNIKASIYSTVSCRTIKPWTSNDVTLKSLNSEGVAISWQTSNATACSSNGNHLRVLGGTIKKGVDPSVNEPKGGESITYTIICTGPGGSASDSITVTNLEPAPPSIVMEREVDGVWTSGSGAVNPGATVNMRWQSANVTSCTGSGIDTGGNTSGTASGISAPTPGNSETYSVSCTGLGGVVKDSITLTTNTTQSDKQPYITLERQLGSRSWSTSDAIYTSKEHLTGSLRFKWNSGGGVTKCRGHGNGLSAMYTKGFDFYVSRPTNGKGDSKTYTVTCTDGKGVSVSDSITVTNNFGSYQSGGRTR